MNPALVLAAIGGVVWLCSSGRPHRGGKPARRPNPRRRNPSLTDSDRRQLEAAQRLSEEFHGDPSHVLELEGHERLLPRFVVEAGKIDEFTYEPGRGSDRGGSLWEHESGDRGVLRRRAKEKPVLAVDPRNRKPVWVPNRSPMKLDPDRGFVG